LCQQSGDQFRKFFIVPAALNVVVEKPTVAQQIVVIKFKGIDVVAE
jgi:hypothetical protein